jgi:hypothetical protein
MAAVAVAVQIDPDRDRVAGDHLLESLCPES